MNIPIIGQRVREISCLRSIVLETNGGCEIRIESSFRIFDPHGGPISVGAGTDEWSWALDRLLGRQITVATHELGVLRLRFDSTAELTVYADVDARAWTVARPDGTTMASSVVSDLV